MNKLKNTSENKSRFFGQYLWQIVVDWEDSFSDCGCSMLHYSHLEMSTIKNKFLRLTPLSQISDEDAIEVGKIRGDWTESPLTRGLATINYIRNTNFSFCSNVNNYLHIIDYLRAKGYLVPYMGISEFDLISYGWVKLKEDK